jgi:hypothetical protein
MNEGPECRRDLAKRLEDAGCEVNTDGTDWLSAGDFTPPPPPSGDPPPEVVPEKAALIARIDVFIGDLVTDEFASRSHTQIFNALLDDAALDDLPHANISATSKRSTMRTGEMRMLLNQAKQLLQT